MKEIKLTKGHVVKVDDEDYEWLNQYSWHALDRGKEADRKRLRPRVVARAAIRVELPGGRYAYEIVYMHRLLPGMWPTQKNNA